MNRFDITMIGEFPPPYGGVTVKNQMVYQKVFQDKNIQCINLMICKQNSWKIPVVFCRIIKGMAVSKSVVIGTSTAQRIKILLGMQWLLGGKKSLNKIMLLVMGGEFHLQVSQDKLLQRLLVDTGSLWVESEKMRSALKNLGVLQTFYFPNGRDESLAQKPRKRENGTRLKLVFFSRICEEKGVDIVMESYKRLKAENLPITLDFYGEVEPGIKERFDSFIWAHGCVHHGVFDTVNGNVYEELNQYDVMLLPTHWIGEGVPGALVESKMAGITAIVSDWHVNSEVVKNNKEGIVLPQTTAETLATAIATLSKDFDRVKVLKEGAYESRKRYSIETYRQMLIKYACR